jgi:hypothetical protein
MTARKPTKKINKLVPDINLVETNLTPAPLVKKVYKKKSKKSSIANESVTVEVLPEVIVEEVLPEVIVEEVLPEVIVENNLLKIKKARKKVSLYKPDTISFGCQPCEKINNKLRIDITELRLTIQKMKQLTLVLTATIVAIGYILLIN